jgi:hypothetical protein
MAGKTLFRLLKPRDNRGDLPCPDRPEYAVISPHPVKRSGAELRRDYPDKGANSRTQK